MIAVVDVAVQAANVSMPLFPWRAFRNSYSSVRVRNVPRKIGKWNITNVTVQVTYPDGSIKTADAVLTGGVWVATVEGTATAGTSIQGYKILASGIDENGQPVSNYCLGRGDVTILEDDGELIPENVITYTRLLSAEPSTPKDGDLWQLSGSWYIYQDGTSYPIGDDSGLIQQLSSELSTKADVSSLTAYELTANMYSDVSSIVLSTETTESWDYQIPQSVVELGYTINSLEYIESEQLWHLDLTIGRESWTWYSNNQQTDTNLTFDEGNAANEFGIIYASWNTTTRNVLGLAMESELSSYELTANMQNDVSAIVLHKTPVEPAQWIWPQMVRASGNDTYYQESYAHQADWDKTKCYYVPGIVQFDNQYELWNVLAYAYQWEEYSESWEEFARVDDPVEAPYDALTLTVTDIDEEFDTFTLQRVAQNTLGLAMESELSDYATTTYAVHNLSGVANITSMPLSSYEAISATADVETLYVITED